MVIDAHLHLWDTERLRYEWLRRPENAAINRTFGFADFKALAAAAGVGQAVLVQADDSAADTEAMFEIAAAHREIAGIRTLIHDRPDPDWPSSAAPRPASTRCASRPARLCPSATRGHVH